MTITRLWKGRRARIQMDMRELVTRRSLTGEPGIDTHIEETMSTVETTEDAQAPTLLLRVEEAALRLGIGRTSMYRLLMDGEIESVQIGGPRRIPAACLSEYVDRLRHSHPDPAA